MKKVLSMIILLVLLVLVTGCDINRKIKVEEPSSGNCSIFECIKMLDTNISLEQANRIMGTDGELFTEGNNYTVYKWYIDNNKNEVLQITFYSTYNSISITFSDEDIKNSKVDFSKYEEIKKSLNNKEVIKYEDIKRAFKVDGTLIEKTSTTYKYRWVNDKGRYINATFTNTTGACTMLVGMI